MPPYGQNMLPPDLTHDGTAEFEITRYELTVRRTLRTGNFAPIRIAPGEPGLSWVTDWVQGQLNCSREEAQEVVGMIGAAWLDARGTKVEVTRQVVQGPEAQDED